MAKSAPWKESNCTVNLTKHSTRSSFFLKPKRPVSLVYQEMIIGEDDQEGEDEQEGDSSSEYSSSESSEDDKV